ncbi:recombinase family protein [Anatilimnocola floriformis]|uniref:recombinase family protein n=1 Tax=Anatilimnocola floriformis TaxID=2948575 RepID=UPI0020C53016|nr:recombinase family protein [Anatilimnocola floriformis]
MKRTTRKLIAYYRVSTAKQGASGLGLEAQRAAAAAYAQQVGGEIIAEYVEVETGKRSDRPQLRVALAHAKRAKATLVVAKLDRLARNVHFVSGLMESGVPFDCADRPGADPFRLHIEAAVAEEEARKISARTKDALQAAKARGTLLGASNPACRNLSDEARAKGAAATSANAASYYAGVLPTILERRAAGVALAAIANELNAAGRVTQRGMPYTATAVHRLAGRV